MNPENVKAGVNRNVKSLTDLQGGLIGGAGSRGAYDDPDDQPIKDLQDLGRCACCICRQHYAKFGLEGLDERVSHCAFCLQFSSKRLKV